MQYIRKKLFSEQCAIPALLLSATWALLRSTQLLLDQQEVAVLTFQHELWGSLISMAALPADELTLSLRIETALLRVVVTTSCTPSNQIQLLQGDFWAHTTLRYRQCRKVCAIQTRIHAGADFANSDYLIWFKCIDFSIFYFKAYATSKKGYDILRHAVLLCDVCVICVQSKVNNMMK